MPPDAPADPPKEPTPDEAEKTFWDKFDARISDILDKKLAGQTPPTTNPPPAAPAPDPKAPPEPGTSRMKEKRVTLPGLIADVVFGPQRD